MGFIKPVITIHKYSHIVKSYFSYLLCVTIIGYLF